MHAYKQTVTLHYRQTDRQTHTHTLHYRRTDTRTYTSEHILHRQTDTLHTNYTDRQTDGHRQTHTTQTDTHYTTDTQTDRHTHKLHQQTILQYLIMIVDCLWKFHQHLMTRPQVTKRYTLLGPTLTK